MEIFFLQKYFFYTITKFLQLIKINPFVTFYWYLKNRHVGSNASVSQIYVHIQFTKCLANIKFTEIAYYKDFKYSLIEINVIFSYCKHFKSALSKILYHFTVA